MPISVLARTHLPSRAIQSSHYLIIPPPPPPSQGVLRLPPLFPLPQLRLVARLPTAVSRRPFLRLDLPGLSSSNKPFAPLLRLLIFHLHLLLECSLAGNGDVVLVGEMTAVERFGQVIEEHLRDGPLEFLLL